MTSEKKYPVMEVFGPTIAGEGSIAGQQTLFVRFGGCDYRCSWCDSMHAVLPELVRENAKMLNTPEIVQWLIDVEMEARRTTYTKTPWISLSGGNPALLDLTVLIDRLKDLGYLINVETQGSKVKSWFKLVDELTISPKPPSSGMVTDFSMLTAVVEAHPNPNLKIVVFDEVDLAFAKSVFSMFPGVRKYLSLGTNPSDTPITLGHRYRELCETVLKDPSLSTASVLLQLHVLAWAHVQGV